MSDHEPVLLPPQLELRRSPAIPAIFVAFGLAAALAAGVFAGGRSSPGSASGVDTSVIPAVDSGAHRGWFDFSPEFPTGAGPNGHLVPINVSRPRDFLRALDALRLDPAAKESVREQVLSGRLRLGAVTVWDWSSEDGDEVTVTSSGFIQSVPLWNAPTTVVVPYTGPGDMISVTGLKDGIGGITVGISVAGSPTNLPRLAPGETVRVAIP